jgi:hypothetical protein
VIADTDRARQLIRRRLAGTGVLSFALQQMLGEPRGAAG